MGLPEEQFLCGSGASGDEVREDWQTEVRTKY